MPPTAAPRTRLVPMLGAIAGLALLAGCATGAAGPTGTSTPGTAAPESVAVIAPGHIADLRAEPSVVEVLDYDDGLGSAVTPNVVATDDGGLLISTEIDDDAYDEVHPEAPAVMWPAGSWGEVVVCDVDDPDCGGSDWIAPEGVSAFTPVLGSYTAELESAWTRSFPDVFGQSTPGEDMFPALWNLLGTRPFAIAGTDRVGFFDDYIGGDKFDQVRFETRVLDAATGETTGYLFGTVPLKDGDFDPYRMVPAGGMLVVSGPDPQSGAWSLSGYDPSGSDELRPDWSIETDTTYETVKALGALLLVADADGNGFLLRPADGERVADATAGETYATIGGATLRYTLTDKGIVFERIDVDGSVVWTSDPATHFGWTANELFAYEEDADVKHVRTDLRIIDLTTGQPTWDAPYPGTFGDARCVVGDRVLLANSIPGEDRADEAVWTDGFILLDAATGEEVARIDQPFVDQYCGSTTFIAQQAAAGDARELVAYDVADGSRLWSLDVGTLAPVRLGQHLGVIDAEAGVLSVLRSAG